MSAPAVADRRVAAVAVHTAFLHHVNVLQNPANCRTAPLYVYIPTGYTSGLGSQVRQIANSLLHAVTLNRTFIVDAATSVYIHPHRCPTRTYDCLFLPLSNCTLDDALADLPDSITSTFTPELSGQEKIAHFPRSDVPAGAEHPRVITSRTSCFKPSDSDLVALERLSSGWTPPAVWWHQHAVGLVARPSARIEELADRLAMELGLVSDLDTSTAVAVGADGRQRRRRGYVGMHIRRGDKVSEARIHKTASYARALIDADAAADDEDGTKRDVLLASDDPDSYKELSSQMPSRYNVARIPDDRFVIQPSKGRVVAAKMVENLHRDAQRKEERGMLPTQRWSVQSKWGDEGEMQVAQLLLLSRASTLVGTLTSNYLLLANEMALRARHLRGEPPPTLIDLDGNVPYACSAKMAPPWGAAFGAPELSWRAGHKVKSARHGAPS